MSPLGPTGKVLHRSRRRPSQADLFLNLGGQTGSTRLHSIRKNIMTFAPITRVHARICGERDADA